MSAASSDPLSLGYGCLAQLAKRVLEDWQKAGAAHAPVLTRFSCCGNLLGETLPDPHWEALRSSAKAWQAAQDQLPDQGKLFWPLDWSPGDRWKQE